MDELRIDELAVQAGVTSRTIRDYQARGLLPPPRLEGRTGWYSQEHLARLELIDDLQERGFSLAAVKATLDAWAQGADLQGLLDLEQLLLAPWGDAEHQAREMQVAELLERFSFLDDLEGAIGKAIESGLLEARGEVFLAPAPVILEAAEELLRLGMDLDDLLELLAATQQDADRIARRYVERVAPVVIRQIEQAGVSAALETVRRLRPLALGSVRAVLDANLRAAIEDRMEQIGIDIDSQGVKGLAGTPDDAT
jgi:DNA-binding transcriptional MerR regulator